MALLIASFSVVMERSGQREPGLAPSPQTRHSRQPPGRSSVSAVDLCEVAGRMTLSHQASALGQSSFGGWDAVDLLSLLSCIRPG